MVDPRETVGGRREPLAGSRDDLPALAERLAVRWGRTADACLVTEPGRELIFGPGLKSVAQLVIAGRTALVPGGLVAPPDRRGELLATVEGVCRRNGWTPLFLSVTDDRLPAFRRAGYGPTKVGEDAVVLLDETDGWRGGRFAAVRKACRRAGRAGVTVGEEPPEPADPAARGRQRGELHALAASHLAGKPQRRAACGFLGGVPAGEPFRRRLFLARGPGGAALGFAAAHPLLGGRRWAVEHWRTDPSAPRGTAYLLARTVLDALRADGATEATLGPVPAVRCDRPLPGDNPLVRRAVVLWHRRCGAVFDTAGLHHFKSRFRPRFEPLYACGRPRVGLAAAAAFVRASGVLDVSPGAVAGRAVRRWRAGRRWSP